MTKSADPDQLASSEINWSGSTLFAKIGRGVQQEEVYALILAFNFPCAAEF